MSAISIKIARSSAEMAEAREVRKKVFQAEQGIDPKLDFDGKDKESDQFIAYAGNCAAGTARIRYISKNSAKLERLAVLEACRKMGIGGKLMDYIINYLRGKKIKNVTLDSQEHAKKFYEKIGFVQEGEVFEEAGIPHVKMQKNI